MLFKGVLLGITGLLAIFLTAIFAANHRAIFPATALVAWAALAYFCVDFGFWSKLFPVDVERMALYRAASEADAGGEPRALPLRLPAHRAMAWLDQDDVLGAGSPPNSCWWRWPSSIRASPPASPGLHRRHRRRRHLPHRLSGAARPGPRAAADPELDAAARLAVRRRHDRARQAVRRHRGDSDFRRPRPHPGAARLHRHAIRLPLDRTARFSSGR